MICNTGACDALSSPGGSSGAGLPRGTIVGETVVNASDAGVVDAASPVSSSCSCPDLVYIHNHGVSNMLLRWSYPDLVLSTTDATVRAAGFLVSNSYANTE